MDDRPDATSRWSRCSTRSRRSSSARTSCSSGCSSPSSPVATSWSRACPAWPRRWRSRRSPTPSAASSTASSSRPTWCPPTSSAPGSTTRSSGEFTTSLGPVFANLVLADEINRAPAKVQSALLEAMQERQVTIGRETHALPEPFLVMATQNPIESEGTYPLPEAQVDRFMLKVLVSYPTATEEFVIVERMTAGLEQVRKVLEHRPARPASSRRPTRSTSTRCSSSTRCAWSPPPGSRTRSGSTTSPPTCSTARARAPRST